MRRILHILTRPDDALAREIAARQRRGADNNVETVDLTEAEPDYKALLKKIFECDSIQTW